MRAIVFPDIASKVTGNFLVAQVVSPVQFLALAFLLLAFVGVLTVLLLSLILWGTGVELPGLSHLLKRISGRRPSGPWITDVLGGPYSSLTIVLCGWIILWVGAAGALWVYSSLQSGTVASTPTEEPVVVAPQPSPTQEASSPVPTPTTAPAAPAPEPPSDVEEILLTAGCGGCHTIKGVDNMVGAVGPELTHIGSVAAERIQDPNYTGSATTPEEYIRESILDPNAYVVEGFQPNIMPSTFSDTLTPEQIDALVQYLASLE